MANVEHLEILKLGVNEWNEWREKNQGIRPDLSSAYLSDIDLSNADLSRANLHNTKLKRVNFYAADLSGASLAGAELLGAKLLGANLSNASFCGASLNGVNLSGMNLSGIRFMFAELRNTNFSGANLANADLSNADMFFAVLVGANMMNVTTFHTDLTSADLTNAKLINAKLTSAKLIHTNMSGADLSGADLSNANFYDAQLNRVNFGETTLSLTKFSLTNLNTCVGLDTVKVRKQCIIDFQTLRASKNIPKSFLIKAGLPQVYVNSLSEFYVDALSLYPVFLLYHWENKKIGRKLYDALISRGINVFFNEMKLKSGTYAYDPPNKGMEHCYKLLLICSRESLTESWWLLKEIDRVLKEEEELRKKGEQIDLLIPITVDNYIYKWDSPRKQQVESYHIRDFRYWENGEKFEKALTDLIYALNVDRPDIESKSFL